MSSISKTAIMSKLTSATALTTLLGKDEGDRPAIYNASLNQVNQPAFPAITFREASGAPDGRFIDDTIDSEYFDIEIWSKSESALIVPAIALQVDLLLHNQTLTLASGECYDCARIAQNPDNFDSKLKLHFGLYRYRLIVRR
jgi:hypothetical protein